MKTMTKADIKSLIEALAKESKLFWSEADFQFAFAWKIQQRFPNAKVPEAVGHTYRYIFYTSLSELS